MKIGIYDKWLRELGGGEKVAFVMAETFLEKGHKVDLISYTEVDKKHLEEKMNVDLSGVNIITWFERQAEKLTPRTEKYDLFINISYLDHLPSYAEKSIYYIHFPTPIKRNILGFIKYETILPFLRKFLIIPEVSKGLLPIDEVFIRAGRWLGLKNRIIFSNAPKKFIVTFRIFAERFTVSLKDSISFYSPNCRIKVIDKRIEHRSSVIVYTLEVKLLRTETPMLEIKIDKLTQRSGLALVSLTVRDFRYFLFNIIKRFLPAYEMALYGSSSYKPAAGLDTYDLFLTHSEFAKKWTKKYWGEEAIVLNPPIDVEEFKPRRKKNIILNVGRFFVGGHSKKQDVLVETFKEMIDQRIFDEDWELHLVGGIAPGNKHELFAENLEKESSGYSIFFHFFADFEELRKLYSEAKIYWHATGFGESANQKPINFEHFGITVVEAMAAGCIPIVFEGGGPPEIVGKQDGFLWSSVRQLKRATQKVASDEKLFNRYSKNARTKSLSFSRKHFTEKFMKIIDSI